MEIAAKEPGIDSEFVDRFIAGSITENESRRFSQQPSEVIAFTMLAIQQRIAQSRGANVPPATIPAYEKPGPKSGKAKKKRKRGAQPGHKGSSRKPPPEPDRTRTQKLDNCPDCGGKLKDTGDTRDRLSEDIPEDLKPVVTKDIIHRDWCPSFS